jgi:hypothetical protein
MPQMSADCLGPLSLTTQWRVLVPSELTGIYSRGNLPVAFLDESFQVELLPGYYIVGAAIVDHELLATTREAMLDFYGGEGLHASSMYSRAEFVSLGQAIEFAASHHDGMDVVVCAPVQIEDIHGEGARARCLTYLFSKLQRDFDTELFVIDARKSPSQNEADRRVLRDLRRAGQVTRETRLVHLRPSQEPLLGLPDLLAWSFRQEFARDDTSWFEPLRSTTVVHRLT